MKKKLISMALVSALAVSMLAGCGQEKPEESKPEESKQEESKQEESKAGESSDEVVEDENAKFYDAEYLSSLTFGSSDWKIDVSEEKLAQYKEQGLKRWDGLEFTWITNDGGYDLPEGQTIDDNEWIWDLQAATGLVPKAYWVATGEAYNEKMNAAIASGDIPDVMRVSMNQYDMLLKSDLIEDLTDYIYGSSYDKANDASAGAVYRVLEQNGRIYGLPLTAASYGSHPLVYIRQDWLEAVGLDEPKCLADLEEIALAFMEADFDGNGKDDTYGIPFEGGFYNAVNGGDGNFSIFFAQFGGAFPGIWQEGDDGKVVYGSVYDGAKEALVFLNDWYNKGIIPKDFATWTLEDLKTAVTEGKAGIAIGPSWICYSQISGNLAVDEDVVWNAYMLPGKEGDEIYGIAGNSVHSIYVIRKGYEHVEELVQAIAQYTNGPKYSVDKDTFDGAITLISNFRPLSPNDAPNYMEVNAKARMGLRNGIYQSAEDMNNKINNGKDWTSYYNQFVEGTATDHILLDQIEAGVNPRQLELEGQDARTAYLLYHYDMAMDLIGLTEKTPVSNLYLRPTESSEIYANFLQTFWVEEYTKMIMGNTNGKSIEEYFDEFKQSYLDQGGQVLTDEVNEAMGR